MEPVLLEKEGPVARLVLNRPDRRNALSLDMMRKIQEKLDEIARDPRIRVAILKGNGPAFSAGHDLRELAGEGDDLHRYREIFSTCSRMMQRFHEIPQPVIAQVHGVATAAGCQLVAAVDLVVAESGARFQTPGAMLGLFCITPMVPLSRVIGRRRALDMLFTGRFLTAEEAREAGLVNRVTAPETLEAETTRWALEIARASRHTLASGKQAFYAQVDLDEPSAYRYAMEMMSLQCFAEDAREGIEAVLEKRPPRWKDR